MNVPDDNTPKESMDFGNSFNNRDIRRFLNSGNKKQDEGYYQAATKEYLKALEEIHFQVSNADSKALNRTRIQHSLRAQILSKIGDNLIYTGSLLTAFEFYDQQSRIAQNYGNDFDVALAQHKMGVFHYQKGSYQFALDFQEKALRTLQFLKEDSEDFKGDIKLEELICKVHIHFGLIQHALEAYEEAISHYEKARFIANFNSLKKEESEILIGFSATSREQLNLRQEKLNIKTFESIIRDLYYAAGIADKNPYIKALALYELGQTYRFIDLDTARQHFQKAWEISCEHNIFYSPSIRNALEALDKEKNDLQVLDYNLEEQNWYKPLGFPKTQEIDVDYLSQLDFEADFVLVTATSIELRAILRLLKPFASNNKLPLRFYAPGPYSGPYYLGKFGYYNSVVTQCRMGAQHTRGATFVTQKALELWKPKAIIMVGIAFGKDSTSQNLGDVLVATKIIDYETEKIDRNGKNIPRGEHSPSNGNLLSLFEQAYEWEFVRPDKVSCKSISGPILSGAKLINNEEFKVSLFELFPDAIGGEMEGVGFCSAANSLQKPWILVKAICDWADGNKTDKNQHLAASSSASLVNYILSQKTILNCFKES